MIHAQPSQPTNNYGDGLSIAFELVATPSIFGFLGFLLDRWVGTTPLFVFAFSIVAFVTVLSLTMWRYHHEMQRADAAFRASRAASGPRAPRWARAEAMLAAEAAAADAAIAEGADSPQRHEVSA
ncbi:MAG: AtpZ/AtpI family protein [Acidimicrobiales bacterium]